jgi:hypothetical protein
LKKTHIFFIIFIGIVIISAIISKIFLFKNTKEITKDNFLSLIEKNYSIIDFKQTDRNGELIISGELNKEDVLALGKEISKKINLDMINILVFKDKATEIENGFYVDGLTNEVTIRNKSKSIKISEFINDSLDPSIKDITIEDGQYKYVKNINGIVYIDIASNNITENRVNEELYLLAKTINSSNKGLKNVIITSKVKNTTYEVSLNNPDISKITENYSL